MFVGILGVIILFFYTVFFFFIIDIFVQLHTLKILVQYIVWAGPLVYHPSWRGSGPDHWGFDQSPGVWTMNVLGWGLRVECSVAIIFGGNFQITCLCYPKFLAT